MLYAYRCTNQDCGHQCDIDLSIKSDGTIKQMCPKCGRVEMERDIVANLQASTFGTASLARDRKFPIVSDALPEYAAGAEHDGDGRAVITSRKHAKEVAKQNGKRWE